MNINSITGTTKGEFALCRDHSNNPEQGVILIARNFEIQKIVPGPVTHAAVRCTLLPKQPTCHPKHAAKRTGLWEILKHEAADLERSLLMSLIRSFPQVSPEGRRDEAVTRADPPETPSYIFFQTRSNLTSKKSVFPSY